MLSCNGVTPILSPKEGGFSCTTFSILTSFFFFRSIVQWMYASVMVTWQSAYSSHFTSIISRKRSLKFFPGWQCLDPGVEKLPIDLVCMKMVRLIALAFAFKRFQPDWNLIEALTSTTISETPNKGILLHVGPLIATWSTRCLFTYNTLTPYESPHRTHHTIFLSVLSSHVSLLVFSPLTESKFKVSLTHMHK